MKHYLTLALIFIIYSCASQIPQTPINCTTKVIEIDPAAPLFSASDNNYSVTRTLELNFNVPTINKIHITSDRVYAFDSEITKMVYCFDKNGVLLTKIGSKGHSKTEFINGVTDFCVNKNTEEVYLFEKETRRIVIFDKNGDFARIINFKKFWPYAFSLLESSNLAIATRMRNNSIAENFELLIIDQNENVINQYFHLDKDHLFTPNEYPFMSQSNSTTFISNMNYDTYIICNDSIANHVNVNFGKSELTAAERGKIKGSVHETSASSDCKVKYISRFFANDYYDYADYSYSGVKLMYLDDKTNNIKYCGSSLFEGFLPSDIVDINDRTIIIAITEEYKTGYDALRSKNKAVWDEIAGKTDGAIIDILETKAEDFKPHLIFIELKANDLSAI